MFAMSTCATDAPSMTALVDWGASASQRSEGEDDGGEALGGNDGDGDSVFGKAMVIGGSR